MKRLFFAIAALLATDQSRAQYSIPRSAEEDKNGVMSEAYWELWNPAEQARIDRDIEKNRKADGFVTLTDVAPGSEVRIEQLSHDFVFGANAFNFNQLGTTKLNNRYKAVFGELLNGATVPFYWNTFELEEGRPRFKEEYRDTEDYWNGIADPKSQPHWRRPATDPLVEFCESKGLRIHGHTLVWGDRKWNHPRWIVDECMEPGEKEVMDKLLVSELAGRNRRDAYTDAYAKLSPRELAEMLPRYTETLRQLFEKRIDEIARYYGDRLISWDVVNESATDYGKGLIIPGESLCKSVYGIMPGEYDYMGFHIADKAFPKNVLLNINENDYNLSQHYADQINGLRERGCRIDIAGAQMHLFRTKTILEIAAGAEIQTPAQVREWYSTLSGTRLPIHLSEITITSGGGDEWGGDIQAVITRNLYRLWFSLESMMGITWWNLVDDCGGAGEPVTSGIFTRDMVEKPSYYALNELINHEWKTRLTAKPDENGRVDFRGFRGRYRITWTDGNGNVQTRDYDLK